MVWLLDRTFAGTADFCTIFIASMLCHTLFYELLIRLVFFISQLNGLPNVPVYQLSATVIHNEY